MPLAKVGELEVNYRVTGEGRPLVLIRGFTASMEEWNPGLLEGLAQRYRVVVFDNRGAGHTVAPPGRFTMSMLGDDTAGLMEALGIDEGYVMGESMGGMVAQQLVLDHPEKVEKLILGCTFCGGDHAVFPSPETLERMADREGEPEDVVRRQLTLLFPQWWIDENPEFIEGFVKRAVAAPMDEENVFRQVEAIMGFDSYDRLPDIKCPTMVMCGTEDVLIPPENSRTLADRIPGARMVEFDGAGHAFIDQCREEAVSTLFDFLG